MAKVSLRIYNREIGTLIDQGQVEEAVGHCNHILKTFPKHLETYQLLGKAYLEAKRYKDASDVFSRLLLSVPDDFVAHVGMSLIADETEQLDDAIWHMQRAFEAQPSNAAVQNELQRLYGRRDGVQPPKIRMTSGALANVYVQGELYPQAIAEIMSVEAEDPGRLDMQVLLARAYFRSGQRVEASKIASDLLAKSPYCLEANRILVEILPETSRSESTQVYRHRVNALDPYAAFAKGSIFNTSDVPDAAVNLERLDWQPGDTIFEDKTNASDVQLGENGEEAQPDWLKTDTNAEFRSATASEPAASPEDDIPDFMKAAGWGTSSGVEEPTSFFDSPGAPEITDDDDEPIAQAELPDWMKNIAPDQAELEAANEDTNEMGDAMADDWINDLLGDSNDEESPQAESGNDAGIGDLGTSSEEQDAAMNWLESLAANQGANPEELITDPNARTEDAPDWVQKAANTGSETPSAPQAEEKATDDSDDMAWLNELAEEETPAPTEQPVPAAEENDMAWLNDLGAEETPATTTDSADDIPEWLRETQETPATPEPVAAATDADDDMAWLNELGAEDAPVPTEQSAPAAEENEMALLNELVNHVEEEAPTPAESAGAVADATIGTLGTSSDEQDAAMNWLESLAANQGANPEELITDPNARTEDAPEWVQKAQDVSESAAPAAEEAAAEDDMAWLNELSDEETPTPATDSVDDDVPEWLRETDETPIPVAEAPVEQAPVTEDDDDDMAWLNELSDSDDAEEAPAEAPVETASPASAETAVPTQPSAGAISDATIGTLGTSSDEQDAAMNWLESLAANQGANPEELITDPNARTEDAPDWVQKAQDVSESAAPAAEEETAAEDDDMAWLNELSDEETPAPATDSADDDVPEWLRETEETPAPPVTEASVEQAPIAEDDDDDMDWLNELSDSDDAEEAPAEAPVETASPASAETAVPTQPSAGAVADATIGTLGTSSDEQDAAMNWLESLAANQGANPEELITDPNARTEDAPEWVQKAQDVSESAAPAIEEMPEQEEVPAEEEAPVAVPAEEPVAESTVEDEEEQLLAEQAEARLAYDAPAPVPSVEEQMPSAAAVEEEAAPSPVPVQEEPEAEAPPAPQEPEAPADDMPDWLKTMADEEETQSPIETPVPPVEESAPPAQEEALPDWLADMSAEEAKPAAANGDMPDWLKAEDAPVPPETPEPTKAEEWKPVAPVAEEKPAPPPEKKPEPPRDLPPRRKVNRMNTTMLRDITLMSAQAAMREGNLSAALAEYGKLIKKKRLLAETIYDLREALYEYPVDISIWQMLGDAYMRAGQLQEAINAYTKAEELLR